MRILFFAILALIFAVGHVFAASTVQITGMNDINLGTYGGSGDVIGNDDVCIYNGDDPTTYSVTITDTSSNSGFNMTHSTSPSNETPVTVYWNDQSGTVGRIQLTHGVALTNQSGADTLSTSCGTAGDTANISLVIDEADAQATYAGTYEQTLTVLIEAE